MASLLPIRFPLLTAMLIALLPSLAQAQLPAPAYADRFTWRYDEFGDPLDTEVYDSRYDDRYNFMYDYDRDGVWRDDFKRLMGDGRVVPFRDDLYNDPYTYDAGYIGSANRAVYGEDALADDDYYYDDDYDYHDLHDYYDVGGYRDSFDYFPYDGYPYERLYRPIPDDDLNSELYDRRVYERAPRRSPIDHVYEGRDLYDREVDESDYGFSPGTY